MLLLITANEYTNIFQSNFSKIFNEPSEDNKFNSSFEAYNNFCYENFSEQKILDRQQRLDEHIGEYMWRIYQSRGDGEKNRAMFIKEEKEKHLQAVEKTSSFLLNTTTSKKLCSEYFQKLQSNMYVNMNYVQSIREIDFFCSYQRIDGEREEQKQEGKVFYFQGISLAVWISSSEEATAFASQIKQVMNYGSILPPE